MSSSVFLCVNTGQGLTVTGSKGLGPIYCAVWSTKDCQVRALLPCGNGKEVSAQKLRFAYQSAKIFWVRFTVCLQYASARMDYM